VYRAPCNSKIAAPARLNGLSPAYIRTYPDVDPGVYQQTNLERIEITRNMSVGATDKPAQDSAERRQVTVMFADMVGSTALSGRITSDKTLSSVPTASHCSSRR
jgi:hypothetical protein